MGAVRHYSGRGDRQRGAAAVELAVILPVVALLFFGIIEVGRAYNARIQLTSAVREGARYAALGGDEATVVMRTREAASGLDPDAVTVTIDPVGGCDAPSEPTDVSVHVSYPFSLEVPFLRSSTITVGATGVMRCGG